MMHLECGVAQRGWMEEQEGTEWVRRSCHHHRRSLCFFQGQTLGESSLAVEHVSPQFLEVFSSWD